MNFIALVCVFFLTSVVSVVTGSTSLITVPVLIAFGIEAHTAVATNMLALVFMSVGGSLPFVRAGTISRKYLPASIGLTVVGSILGALALLAVPPHALQLIIAGAMTGGDLNIAGCDPSHLSAVLGKLHDAGVKTRTNGDSVRVMGDNPFTASDISTEEYPGFPTDCQAQFMALATQAEGTSIVTENIFENRFMHAQELVRMGANVKIEGRRAVVRGKSPLSAAAVLASDLRASASLVLAALVADGETIIDRVYHIDRGYENIEEKLKGVGAEIRRVGDIFPKRASAPAR